MGHYQLAVAQSVADTNQAFFHLNKALALKADFVAARFARGVLNYQLGKPAAALPDFEFTADREPENAGILDRLGQAYLALDRPADAVRLLRKAVDLAPKDSKILLRLGRALADAGQHAEAAVVMERFRQLGPDRAHRRLPAGLVDFLSMSPEEQYADYRARVEQAVRKDPADADAKVQYLRLLLDDDNLRQAADVARQVLALKPPAEILSNAGRALLEADQYALAKETLEQAAGAHPTPDIQLDVAIATFHATGAKAGLAQMDRIAVAQRTGDYYLARAQMLDASGALEDAVLALNQALRAAPRRPELYRQATYFLIKNNHVPEALQLLDQATRLLPNNPEILLMKATSLELTRKTEEAEILLDEIQNRWPEWSNAWVAHGIILESHKRSEEARQTLETAIALGARSSEVYFYLAECTLRAAPERIAAAEEAVRKALELAPQDPWVRALAGRIAFEQGHYQNAVDQLQEAIRLRPHFVQAHYNLAQAYAALDRKQESRSELDQVTLIQEKFPHADEEAAEVMEALFRVKSPRDW
jgi:protein O-GlcNAc transferase